MPAIRDAAVGRFAFNATCTVLTAGVMAAFGYFLDHQSTDLNTGLALGMMGTLAILWLCHRMGARIF